MPTASPTGNIRRCGRCISSTCCSFRLSYYTGSHSGRLVKVMMSGTSTLWGLWLSFFREHLASFVSLIVLLPLTLFINWRYGLLLIALCAIFGVVIAVVIRKSEQLQSKVEGQFTDVIERTTDTLGNIALVQSFARIETEVSGMKKMGEQVLSAQLPVLSWWAVTSVITRTSTTLTMLAILILGVWFYIDGRTTVGEIVMFMSFASLLITRLEQAVNFANRMVMDAPRVSEFLDVLDTEPAVRDRPGAIDPGRVRGMVEFVARLVFLRRQAARGRGFELHGVARGDRCAGRGDRRRKIHRARFAAPGLRAPVGSRQDRRHGHSRAHSHGAPAQHRRRISGSAVVESLDRREPARRQAGCV